jgi:hypothetical protein
MDLKGKRIFVLTNPELGWDCVCGVYAAESEEALIEYLGEDYNADCDVIHDQSSLQVVKTKAEIRDAKIDKVVK